MNTAGVLRSRARMVVNGLRRPRRARAGGRARGNPLVALVLGFVLAGLFAYGLSSLFGTLAAGGASAAETAPLLAVVLSAALTGMLVFDVHHAVASMLLDPDLEWFRRAPVRARAMFAVKMLDSLPRTAALLLVLALPAIATWTERYPGPGWAFALWPVWLAALWAIPMGLGTALGMLLLRAVPPRSARAALGLLSTLTLVTLWFGNSFLLPQAVEQGEALVAGLRGSAVAPWLAAISPGHAIALAMAAAAEGRAGAALLPTAWLALAGTLSLGIAALAAQATFAVVQDHLAAPPGRGRAAPRRTSAPPGGLVRAVVARDLALFTREWTVLGDIATAAVLWTLLPVLSARLITATPALMVRAMLVALTVGLGYEIAARAVPFERGALVWARLSPVSAIRWVWAKWVAVLVMALPVFLTATLVLALAIPLPPIEWAVTLVVGLSALSVALSLGLLTGLVFGDPDWTNPRAMLTVSGRIVATGLLLAQAVGWLGWSALAWLRPQFVGPGLWWAPAAVALAVTLAATRLSAGRLRAAGQRH